MSVFNRLWRSLGGRGEPSAPEQPKPVRSRPAAERPGPERRKLARIRVLSALQGYGVELDTKVIVREVSPGGFSVESPLAFAVGMDYTFLFSTADGTET